MSVDDRETTNLSVADAARRLGVSEQEVLQRIRDYTLFAVKVDGIWRITLPDQEVSISRVRRRPAGSIYARARLTDMRGACIAPLVERIEELSRDVGRLGPERDAAREERGQLRAEVDRLHRDQEQVSIGVGVTVGVLAGLIGWFLTESTGWAVVIGLLVETSVWLWFRWVA